MIDEQELAETVIYRHFLSIGKLLPLAKMKQEFLVEGLIPAKAITIMVGQPGSMKSWLAYDMAIAVSRGAEWLEEKAVRGPVLILNYDNPTPELARRLARLGADPGDQIHVHTSTGLGIPLRFPDSFPELRAAVQLLKPSLIVIDSLRQAHRCDESDNRQMAVLMHQLKEFTGLGAAVLLLHHRRKVPTDPNASGNALDEPRGSTEISASADCIISIKDETMHWIKTRGWPMIDEESHVGFEVKDEGDRTVVRSWS